MYNRQKLNLVLFFRRNYLNCKKKKYVNVYEERYIFI